MKMKSSYYKILPWDSNFFSFRVAQITASIHDDKEFSMLIDEMKQAGIELTYWFVDIQDQETISLAERHNLFLVDKKITYKKSLDRILTGNNHDNIISLLGNPVSDKLLSLALQSGKYSRFKVDPNFPDSLFIKLYKHWITASVAHEIAEEVLVYTDNDSEEGVITLEVKDDVCAIGLFAVDKQSQRKGIGTELIHAAFEKAKNLGYKEIYVSTQQDNKNACAFYEKLGFVPYNAVNVYHIWLNHK